LEPIVEVAGYVSMAAAFAMGAVGWNALVFWAVIGLGPAILFSMAAVVLEN
jgi:hypothetical protein